MNAGLFRARSTLVWFALVVVTIVSWAAGAEHEVGSGIGVIVLAFAAIKVRFVGLDFMELRGAPWLLRGLFEGYCIVLWCVLSGIYLWL